MNHNNKTIFEGGSRYATVIFDGRTSYWEFKYADVEVTRDSSDHVSLCFTILDPQNKPTDGNWVDLWRCHICDLTSPFKGMMCLRDRCHVFGWAKELDALP